MLGKIDVRVRNNRNDYEFTLKRNITVLCGDSGTGKTTLYEMIRDFNRYGKSSNVRVSCNKPVIALLGDDWQERLAGISDSVIVVDEDNEFLMSDDFARAIKGSDNYYILETRNYLSALPYSVDEIYELSGQKNKRFKPLYKGIDRMYDDPDKSHLPFVPEVIITEDSGSGFEFFRNEADKFGIECVSAKGKSRIFAMLKSRSDKNVVVIADGAAFGAEMANVIKLQKMAPKKLAVFLPESFEWLILRSGTVPAEQDKIVEPEKYADSRKYMSWEQYFTDILRKATEDTPYMRYRKEKLADYYTQEGVAKKIVEEIKGIRFEG